MTEKVARVRGEGRGIEGRGDREEGRNKSKIHNKDFISMPLQYYLCVAALKFHYCYCCCRCPM